MNEVTSRRRPIAGFLIKILVVLLFPLSGYIWFPEFRWTSLLITINLDYDIIIRPVLSLLAILVVMLPCLIFEHKLNTNPISKSVRGRAAGAAILSWFLTIPVPSGYIFPYEIYHLTMIQYVPVLSISFFIILPLISREATLKRISLEHHTLSVRLISSTLRKKIRREKLLSGLLWTCLIFSPFIFYFDYMDWTPSFQFMSLFYESTVSVTYPFLIREGLPLQIYFSSTMALLLPFTALLSALRFVFVRDVFRFQSGLVKKQRLASVALLGEILPSAIIIFMLTFLYGSGVSIPLTFFPLPILPIIGFLHIRFSRTTPVQEELWPKYEHRMWFEKERTPYTPEPVEESIKVPITYLLVSQIRRRRKQ